MQNICGRCKTLTPDAKPLRGWGAVAERHHKPRHHRGRSEDLRHPNGAMCSKVWRMPRVLLFAECRVQMACTAKLSASHLSKAERNPRWWLETSRSGAKAPQPRKARSNTKIKQTQQQEISMLRIEPKQRDREMSQTQSINEICRTIPQNPTHHAFY